MPPGRAALALFTWLGAAACEPDAAPGTVERTRVGDTLVVFSPAPLHTDTIRGREAMRFGELTGDPELLFGDIYAFAPTSDGGLLVHDAGEGIRRYDREGNFVGRVARTGAGPGEVRYVRALAEDRDGTIAAYDIGNNRISIYDQGRIRTLPRPEGMPRYGGDAVVFTRDSSLRVAVSPPFPETGGVPHPRPIFARVGEDGTLRDTIFTPEGITANCPELSSRMYRRGFWEDARAPFTPKVTWTMAADGSLLLGCPAGYEFDVIRPDGTVHRIGRRWDALRITDEHRDFLVTQAGIGGLAAERPAYARLVALSEGRIWVRPTLPSEQVPLTPEMVERFGITHTWEESTRAIFDVFTVEDGWLGTVALPPEARYTGFPTEPPLVVRGDSIWVVATDSLDVQYVVKYVVEWPGS